MVSAAVAIYLSRKRQEKERKKRVEGECLEQSDCRGCRSVFDFTQAVAELAVR